MMLLINMAGIALIALIVWWFWLYKPDGTFMKENKQVITIENGVYSPAHIRVPAGQDFLLTFLRKDPSPCAETLLIPALAFSDTLPLNKEKTVRVPALGAGEYAFHCQMQMYRGSITAG
ncbi:cupredoxin domain-containing protein [Thalassolituus sp. LLYu03]|uniref:cupredoxin domain-containing protein n=1 Tax=Thalassolituus sp. LLYu03 TaxID=3421656 RepID=UPI003D2C3968